MPVHDWTKVEAGIFHHFHHAWIEEIARALNAGALPDDYYALAEQHAAGFGPDVLTLQTASPEERDSGPLAREPMGGLLLAPPKLRVSGETEMEFYRRKQKWVAVRHVSGDHLVAVVEIVSRGNKSTRNALRAFVEKAASLLDQRIHLLIVDLHPPGKHDPQGIHAAIWDDIAGEELDMPADKPLTQVVYESALIVKAYSTPLAVGDLLAGMPLFLEPFAQAPLALEATYERAFAALPRRWSKVLEPNS